ncbi:MAG: hypothetical protein Q9164_001780 [Protoblastenia rupestris]
MDMDLSRWSGQFALPAVDSSTFGPAFPSTIFSISIRENLVSNKTASEERIQLGRSILCAANTIHIEAQSIVLRDIFSWMVPRDTRFTRSVDVDAPLVSCGDWANIEWLNDEIKNYKMTPATASWYLSDGFPIQCAAMFLHPLSPCSVSDPLHPNTLMNQDSLLSDRTFQLFCEFYKLIPPDVTDNRAFNKTFYQASAVNDHEMPDYQEIALEMMAKRPRMLTNAHDICAFCLDLAVEKSPIIRAKILTLVGPTFPYLLLPRTLKDEIAIDLIQSGSLDIVATCTSLHRHLMSLVLSHGVCRLTIGPDQSILQFPNTIKERLHIIKNVSIQVLRTQDPRTYSSDRNSGLIQIFRGTDVVRDKCEINIIGKPGETFSMSDRFRKDLGSLTGFKKVILNISSIPVSVNITQGSISYRPHTQKVSWSSLYATATQLMKSLGPFLLTNQGAVFHPHNCEVRKQIYPIAKIGKSANPNELFMYVPGQPLGGRSIIQGSVMRLCTAPAVSPILPSYPTPDSPVFTVPPHVMATQHAMQPWPTTHAQSMAHTQPSTVSSAPPQAASTQYPTPGYQSAAHPSRQQQNPPDTPTTAPKKRQRNTSRNTSPTQANSHPVSPEDSIGPDSSNNTHISVKQETQHRYKVRKIGDPRTIEELSMTPKGERPRN